MGGKRSVSCDDTLRLLVLINISSLVGHEWRPLIFTEGEHNRSCETQIRLVGPNPLVKIRLEPTEW